MSTTAYQVMEVAIAHYQAGRMAEAAQACRQALALDPQWAPALNLLGVLALQAGQAGQALELISRAVAIDPADADYQTNLGEVYRVMGNLDQAIAALQRAIALDGGHAQAHRNLGLAMARRGQIDQAIALFTRAVALNPADARAHGHLGTALCNRGRLAEALAAYQRAAALEPASPVRQMQVAYVLQLMGLWDEAVAACQRAIALRPGLAEAHSNLATALKDMGQIDAAVAEFRKAVELDPDPAKYSNLLYALHFHPDYTADDILREHVLWNQRHAAPLKSHIRPHGNDRSPERRLRIGYVSPNLRAHVIGRFLLPLLTCHNREQFEIFCYANLQQPPDDLTRLLAAQTDHWRNISALDDEQAAQLVRHDGIDILVDLSVHMGHNRLLLFARKPAPVQVTYLAYCGTTGLDTIDYRLTDPYLDPPGPSERSYTEKSVYLPETYWCYQPVEATPEVGSLPALSAGHTTFGCLNTFSKVSPAVLAAWCKLLRTVPESRLLLYVQAASQRQRLQQLLIGQGLDPKRLSFTGWTRLPDYFQSYNQIDIALDPFPYAGGTTSCDALWMGVPLVTLAGPLAVGRGGVSILSNVGLPDLIAQSADQYVSIAARLAGDLDRLGNLRSTMRQRMQQSALMDAPRFARNMEAAYRQMWRQTVSGVSGRTV